MAFGMPEVRVTAVGGNYCVGLYQGQWGDRLEWFEEIGAAITRSYELAGEHNVECLLAPGVYIDLVGEKKLSEAERQDCRTWPQDRLKAEIAAFMLRDGGADDWWDAPLYDYPEEYCSEYCFEDSISTEWYRGADDVRVR
jgi:hypothetical protein